MDYYNLKNRLNAMKENLYYRQFGTMSYKEIIKKAIKIQYPNIPDRANDMLSEKLLNLDFDEVLKMGKDEIYVGDLIENTAIVIEDMMKELDENYEL